MAYNKKELEEMSINAITEHNLIDIQQVVSFLPCSRTTFYNLKLDKLNTIKETINKSKINNKVKLFNKWIKSDNATLQIAAYKLMAEDSELNKLVSSKFDHSSKDGSMTPKETIITTMTSEQLKEAIDK